MFEVIIFIVLLLVLCISLLVLTIKGVMSAIRHIRRKNKSNSDYHLKKNLLFAIISFIVLVTFIWITQITASTPAIRDEDGKVVPGSIAELRKIELNGRKEWISIRGNDRNNPVLLFLAGGPGGSQMAAVRYDLAELEKHFVVVNWDQPGSGKSFGTVKTKAITVDTYIDDGYALTKYLCEEFHQNKIILVGESWGSALGIFLSYKYPEFYQAFIGTGQMVAFQETEILDYQKALELADENGDTDKIDKLKANGLPPYYGNDVTWKSAEYLQYLSDYMTHDPEIQNNGYNTLRDIFASEYGMIDKINYLRGVVTTFNHVYPQLYTTDLRKDYNKIEIPIYFFEGSRDLNAPPSLVEDYYNLLDAPEKEIVWFEHSGHNPWINESDLFVKELLRVTKCN